MSGLPAIGRDSPWPVFDKSAGDAWLPVSDSPLLNLATVIGSDSNLLRGSSCREPARLVNPRRGVRTVVHGQDQNRQGRRDGLDRFPDVRQRQPGRRNGAGTHQP